MIGLCDNCALKYADCKGNKDKEKCRCDYYKKPVVMNVKELAERVAELEIELEHCRRIIWQQEAALEAYMDMSDELEKHQWIPVTELEPKPNEEVLVTYKRPDGAIAVESGHLNYDSSFWWDSAEDFSFDASQILAWMPLPEPYKEV